MRIGIIDAEIMGKNKHRFPNLCCMKISAWHKSQGDDVELCLDYNNIDQYDKVYLSKVFIKTNIPNEPEDSDKSEQNCIEYYSSNTFLMNPKISYGGTGFFYDKAPNLPTYIEHIKPDYDLYNDWIDLCIDNGAKEKQFTYYKDYSIGFLTRGCFRKCEFCVNKKYNNCQVHSPLDEFIDYNRRKLCFLDDNFFACSEWGQIIEDVKSTNKRFQFKQGLDERLLTEDKVKEMLSWKYDGDYIFAFDNINDKDMIINKLELFKKYFVKYQQRIKFYVFCGYDRQGKYDNDFFKQDLMDTFERIKILKNYDCEPYIMRHEMVKYNPYRGTYINLASYCNQPNIFFKMPYKEYCVRKSTKPTSSTIRYYKQLEQDFPDIIDKYFDLIGEYEEHYE